MTDRFGDLFEEPTALSQDEIKKHAEHLRLLLDRHVPVGSVDAIIALIACVVGDISHMEFHLHEIADSLGYISSKLEKKGGDR